MGRLNKTDQALYNIKDQPIAVTKIEPLILPNHAGMSKHREFNHFSLNNIGTYTHVQIDSHIDDTSIHFTEASIDHNSITNTHNLTTDIDHDQLTNFVANEHLDWTQSVGTIHADNYTDTNTTYLGGTNLTLAGITFNVDDAFLKNDATDIGVGLTLTGDNSSADTAYVPMVLYNTDAIPPAASGFPIGTIYIQYTA